MEAVRISGSFFYVKSNYLQPWFICITVEPKLRLMKRILFVLLSCSILFSCYNEYSGAVQYWNPAVSDMEVSQSEKYTDYAENPFVKVAEEPQSTFGIDADGGSYSNTRRFLNLGQLPPKESVRIEEYINYFTFEYASPVSENVSINTETSTCPWNEGHLLFRIGLKGKSLNESEIGPSNFVFLIDVSGSMSSPDKLELLKSGFKMLVDEMNEDDRIAIVTYASADKVILKSTPCSEKSKIKRAIGNLGSGGSTAGAQGIITAYEIAEEYFIEGGNNRVIIGSDGDFNVGPSSNEELVDLIEEKRESGIYLTVLGVGQGNLNDSMMEQLANNGNGNYEYIDNVDQLKKVFIYEKQKFYTVAKDCKIQITFNPNSVDSYRLIGYENRVLNNEDFEKDTVDAGEIGADQTITAFYELIPSEDPMEKFCTLQFRYKKPNESTSILLEHEAISNYTNFEDASENMQFGAAVVGFGLLMKESEYKGDLNYSKIVDWASKSLGSDEFSFRSEFMELVDAAQDLE